MSELTGSITDAGSPFDDPEADVIVRSSSSRVDFLVFKPFLSFASPVFKDMFTLPQGGNAVENLKNGRPIIPVEEDSETLELLLKFCYPRCAVDPPILETLESVIRVLKASIKYDMEGVEKRVREVLISLRFVHKEPLRIFALAFHHRLEPEIRMAAKQTLRFPILGHPYIEELEMITGGMLHRLQEYHTKCGKLAIAVATNMHWITKDSFIWFECADCMSQRCSVSIIISENRRKFVWSKWWREFMEKATMALRDRPSGATVLSSELMDEALGNASLCSTCRTRAFKEMREFCEMFAAEVDRVTMEVSMVMIDNKCKSRRI